MGMKQSKESVGDAKAFHVVENGEKYAAWSEFKFPGHAARVDQCRFGLRIRRQDRLKVKTSMYGH